MPLTASAMGAWPAEAASHATATYHTVRHIASTVVVALFSSVTQNVSPSNNPAATLKTQDPIADAAKVIDASLNSLHASFVLGFVFVVIGFIVTLFLRKGMIEET